MKKAIAIVLALLMALTPLGAFAPGEVIAEAETNAPDSLTDGSLIPVFNGGTVYNAGELTDCGDDHWEVIYENVAAADAGSDGAIDQFKTAITGAEYGFGLFQENTVGNNRFMTFSKPAAEDGFTVVHCNYFAALNEFRIIYGMESYLGAASAADVPAYTAAAEPSVSIIGMSDTQLCIVVQLADGSFIIVDGGYGYSAENRVYNQNYYTRQSGTFTRNHFADMEGLYDFLVSKTPSGSKPQITWMITHADPDHITLPYVFMNNYSSGISVNTVVYNFPSDSILSGFNVNSETGATSATYAASFKNSFQDADQYIYHTGQKMYLPGCEIEFLMTHEDMYPAVPARCNHTSGAWRMTIDGRTILILGDCETELNRQMDDVFGEYLSSDILQPAHHGSNGGYLGLYEHVAPSVCLWPCGDFPFYYSTRHTGTLSGYEFNAYLRNKADTQHFTNSATHTIKLSALAEELSGGALVHQGAYAGRKGNAAEYLSDLYGTARMKYAHGSSAEAPFTANSSYQGDGSKTYPIYIWNSAHTVNVVHPTTHAAGRSIATLAEGTRTFFANEIVLGYQGRHFEKGLGGHLISAAGSSYDCKPSAVVFDITGSEAGRFYAVAGLTGDAANKPTAAVEGTNDYGVTFAVYGSMADEYSDSASFTLLSKVGGIGGYADTTANSKVYNTAEFDLDVTGYNFLKLEAITDGNAGGGSYAWGDACLYEPVAANKTLASTDTFSGKSSDAIESTVTYLSSLTEKSSFVIGYQNSVTDPITFYKDRSYPLRIKAVGHASDLDLLSFYAGSTSRLEIYTGQSGSTIQSDSEGVYRVENGVTYRPTTIALSAQGTVFEHGLSAIVGPANKKATSIVYDVSGLNAQRFYSAVGITSRGNQNATGTYPYKLTFWLYGSKTGTDDSDFELIAYVPAIRAWLAGEIDEDITGYKYLKLETSSDAAEDSKINWNNNYQFNSGFAWGDACVYKLKQPGISDNVGLVLHENLGVSCFADFADESADGAVMRFEYGEYTKDIPLPETAEVNGTYKFTYNGITPWTMGDEVTATLISGDGQELGSKTFSLKQLCQAYLDAESIDGYTNDQLAALKTLINDLLVYGGTLQTYTGYKTGSLVSDGITGSDGPINDPDMIDISGRIGSGVTVKSATIMHGNVNYLRVRFSLNGETSINDVAMNMTLGETTVPMNITDGGINEYYATSPGLMPTQYDDVLTVSASVNENDDASIVYSLNSYAYRMFNRENTDNGVKALVKAMYHYGVSAEEYLRAINQ